MHLRLNHQKIPQLCGASCDHEAIHTRGIISGKADQKYLVKCRTSPNIYSCMVLTGSGEGETDANLEESTTLHKVPLNGP